MRGLPQKGAYETVLRDGLAADSLDPLGIYMGTRSGQLFASRDEGKTWEKILDGLPPVLCIRTALIEDGSFSAESTVSKPVRTASSRRTKSRTASQSRRTKR